MTGAHGLECAEGHGGRALGCLRVTVTVTGTCVHTGIRFPTQIVETERGVSTTYSGNYTAYLRQKSERYAQQLAAYEKQQKELKKLRELVQKLSGGAQSGRAAQAQKQARGSGDRASHVSVAGGVLDLLRGQIHDMCVMRTLQRWHGRRARSGACFAVSVPVIAAIREPTDALRLAD